MQWAQADTADYLVHWSGSRCQAHPGPFLPLARQSLLLLAEQEQQIEMGGKKLQLNLVPEEQVKYEEKRKWKASLRGQELEGYC